MKVVIKEWNGVASWRWDMPEDEVCGICRVQFDGTCPTCKYPGDDCALRMCTAPSTNIKHRSFTDIIIIVIGKCGHSFHMVSMSYESSLARNLVLVALPSYVDSARFIQRSMSYV